MNFQEFLCWVKSWGTHYLSSIINDGDQYCFRCGKYLYTEYHQQINMKERDKSYKMWWQIK